jgi:hypothetical protein
MRCPAQRGRRTLGSRPGLAFPQTSPVTHERLYEALWCVLVVLRAVPVQYYSSARRRSIYPGRVRIGADRSGDGAKRCSPLLGPRHSTGGVCGPGPGQASQG